MNGSITDNNITIYRFESLPFGPFLLSATIDHHLDEINATIAQQIKGDIYVDNVVMSKNNDHEGLQLYKEAGLKISDIRNIRILNIRF